MRAVVPALPDGGHLRVVAPSRSMAVLSSTTEARALDRLARLGYTVSFGRHVRETGFLDTADMSARLEDLHEAYADPEVDAILTVIGGTRCFDLLEELDWQLVRANPKPLCGYSDISVLLNAVWAKTRTVTFLGPHFSSFAMPDLDAYQAHTFRTMLRGDMPVRLVSTTHWSDDPWYTTGRRTLIESNGWSVVRPGRAVGRLIGGNLSSLMLLRATPFAPDLEDAVLLVEDIAAVTPGQVQRSLVALSHAEGFDSVKGIIFGRFQRRSGIDCRVLSQILASLPSRYQALPILAEVELGHTQPIATFPIGGIVALNAGPASDIVLFPDQPSSSSSAAGRAVQSR